MPFRYVIILIFIVAGVSAGLTHYYFPSTQIKTVEKDIVKNNVITVTHTVKEPNGTVITDSTTTDHSARLSQNVQTEKPTPKWTVSGLLATDFDLDRGDFTQHIYGLEVSRKVLGPFSIGAFGLSSGIVGVSVGYSF